MTSTKLYLLAMAASGFVFGLVTTFYPPLMNLFQTQTGIDAATVYSNHVWRHDGFDIISVSVLFFALSRDTVSRTMLRASAIAALFVAVAIFFSLITTNYWNPLFLVPGVSSLALWGFALASKTKGVRADL